MKMMINLTKVYSWMIVFGLGDVWCVMCDGMVMDSCVMDGLS